MDYDKNICPDVQEETTIHTDRAPDQYFTLILSIYNCFLKKSRENLKNLYFHLKKDKKSGVFKLR